MGRKKNCLFVEPTETQSSTQLDSFLNSLQRIISVNQETEEAEKEETNQRRNMWKSCNSTHLICFSFSSPALQSSLQSLPLTTLLVPTVAGTLASTTPSGPTTKRSMFGDLISFRYPKNQYNVFEVNQTGYDNCTLDSAVGNWSSGKDFIPLNQAKRYYFICGNGQCYNGMKVSVVVHPLPSPPKAAPSAHNSSSDSAVLVVPRQGFRALAVSLAMLCFGFGWV
ncbi:unnamed protein product [Prunus armeniaca]|uniref:Phytocyanin domain-containing protein n=1 Tax=Prunus armeniaca TaxID=36596 RepID=A0A6J5U9R2_PRUAR|nr:unnamed protein product [Prunus armeniaca]